MLAAPDVLGYAAAAVVIAVFLGWLGPPPLGPRYRRTTGVIVRKTTHDAAPDGPDMVTVLIAFAEGGTMHQAEYITSSWLVRIAPGDAIVLYYRRDNPGHVYLADALVIWSTAAVALVATLVLLGIRLLAG